MTIDSQGLETPMKYWKPCTVLFSRCHYNSHGGYHNYNLVTFGITFADLFTEGFAACIDYVWFIFIWNILIETYLQVAIMKIQLIVIVNLDNIT